MNEKAGRHRRHRVAHAAHVATAHLPLGLRGRAAHVSAALAALLFSTFLRHGTLMAGFVAPAGAKGRASCARACTHQYE